MSAVLSLHGNTTLMSGHTLSYMSFLFVCFLIQFHFLFTYRLYEQSGPTETKATVSQNTRQIKYTNTNIVVHKYLHICMHLGPEVFT